MRKINLFPVGKYIPKFNTKTKQDLPCGIIYQSSGLVAHVAKHHPDEVYLLDMVPQIIKEPDFIGQHPKEPYSIELVKTVDKNVMVCIKLDQMHDYIFVASVFSISNAKLKKRIDSGRLILY